jgi:hypothetical protein
LFKVVLILLVLLGAAFYFPQTRPVVVDTLAPVMNPVLTWQTRGEMEGIVRELQTLSRQGNDLPTPGESFNAWMLRNFMGGSKTDAWGVNYTLRIWRDSIGIVSNGPDREIETADDIMETAMVQRRGDRR